MTGMVAAAIIVGTIFFIFQVGYTQSRGRRERLDRLTEERDALQAKLNGLTEEKDLLKKNIEKIELQLSVFEATSSSEIQNAADSLQEPVPKQEGDDDLLGTPKETKHTGAPRSPIDILIQQKLLSQAQLDKAEKYRKDTDSRMPLEEILVMFEYISAAQLKTANHFFNSLNEAKKKKQNAE